MISRRVARWVDEHSGGVPLLKKTLRYVFPDHWSFLLGEIALYSFVVLVGTGVFLSLFFEPSYETVVYDGAYGPLQGREMSQAYESVVDISFEVRAGLLMRQTHHWAANVFVAAIVLHLLRVFFTGAFRKPRRLIYYVGVTMLMLAILEGFLGYSLIDDLLSGMGLAIAYGVAESLPFFGANFALLVWDGPFPGTSEFASRMYLFHVLLLPVAIGALISIHLALVALLHHTQFRGPRKREDNVVGTPLWPGYALRSLGLMCVVAGTLFLLGGLVQINPVWLWGPFQTWLSTNAAQPDWYLGWLIGGLRLMPAWEPHAFGYTFVPNPFWGGAMFPLIVFGFLLLWPAIERRVRGDDGVHHLLERPRDNPWRTAVGTGFFTWVFVVFVAASADRVAVQAGISYSRQIDFWRIAMLVAPFVAAWVAYRVAADLKSREDSG